MQSIVGQAQHCGASTALWGKHSIVGQAQHCGAGFLSTLEGTSEGTSVGTYCTVRLKHITHAKKFHEKRAAVHTQLTSSFVERCLTVTVPRSKLQLCFTSPTGSVVLTVHDKGHEHTLEYCQSTVKGHDRHHKGSSTW